MSTYIFDLDGVLVDNTQYHEYYTEDTFDSDKFNELIPKMKKNYHLSFLLNDLLMGNTIIILTARSGKHKEKTIKWLEDNEVFYDEIYFNEGNLADAGQFKLDTIRKFKLPPDLIFDDDPQVVSVLRRAGYWVLQPNYIVQNQ